MKTVRSIRIEKSSLEFLQRKAKELGVSQGNLITYAFNKLNEEDYKQIRKCSELVEA